MVKMGFIWDGGRKISGVGDKENNALWSCESDIGKGIGQPTH